MNWSSTISAVFESTEEDEIGYYTPVNYKLAVFCNENDPCRGTRCVEEDMLLVYMYNLSDYKGDIFDSVTFGSVLESIGNIHTVTFKELEDLAEKPLELYDYLLETGKII